MNTLEELVIDSLANDYESFEIICSEIASYGYDQAQILAALKSVIHQRFVRPFVYDKASQRFMETALDESSIGDFWFGLSREGRVVQEQLASREG